MRVRSGAADEAKVKKEGDKISPPSRKVFTGDWRATASAKRTERKRIPFFRVVKAAPRIS
jgi:hypothetical protein|tara:strand:- start:673 stop:852 length:180 start_codon:yes stop_codon:yes gene_type:complete